MVAKAVTGLSYRKQKYQKREMYLGILPKGTVS